MFYNNNNKNNNNNNIIIIIIIIIIFKLIDRSSAEIGGHLANTKGRVDLSHLHVIGGKSTRLESRRITLWKFCSRPNLLELFLGLT